MVKNLSVMQELGVQSLTQKDPWRRKWQSSILTWEMQWTEEPGGMQSMGSQKSRT